MYYTILDTEVTFTLQNGKTNPSPYLSTNKLVSVGTLSFNKSGVIDKQYLIFNHTELKEDCQAKNAKILQSILDKTEVLICFNSKFDVSWLLETGFNYNKALYDCMIFEYVASKGLKRPLSLAESCVRYGLSPKTDILSEYRKRGFNTDEVPIKELIEYGENDVKITYELYNKQQELIQTDADCAYMSKAVNLMCTTLWPLIEMERSGICIDITELDRVEKEYREEYDKLKTELSETVVTYMGHTPINLESPEHLSWVLYSRKVNNKKKWAEIFNIGSELRGSVNKAKYARWMSNNEFVTTVKDNTTKLKKTEALQCSTCQGKGTIQKVKKDGQPFKKRTICHNCTGNGFTYVELNSYAGFKLLPLSSKFASSGGFSTDKGTIEELLKGELKEDCREFLTKLLRLNAISTYLSTFVEGIRKNTIAGFLHTSLNQCVTATGRLSSSNPNFQNLPRAKTFPIRKVIKSRFIGGKIVSADFSQLEFRAAAILANDKQALEDIINNVDIHSYTRDTLNAAGMNIDRQQAKAYTFKPLFGGITGTKQEVAYYRAFLQKYSGIDAWQKGLENEALYNGQIKSPTGRIFAFNSVKRRTDGTVTNHTQIKNYPVQSFATGDIIAVTLIEIYKALEGMKSKLVLTVHDSVEIDAHPDEIYEVINKVKFVFSNFKTYLKEYFNMETAIPISGEVTMGDNWLEKVAA